MDQSYEIYQNLKQLQRSIRSHMEGYFKSMKLTAPQGMLVFLLAKKGPHKISEIGKAMGLSNSTVSGIVDRLERIGYVRRERSNEDRRVVRVVVSDEMNKKICGHEKQVDQFLDKALSSASEKEINDIRIGLSTLTRLVDESMKGEK